MRNKHLLEIEIAFPKIKFYNENQLYNDEINLHHSQCRLPFKSMFSHTSVLFTHAEWTEFDI